MDQTASLHLNNTVLTSRCTLTSLTLTDAPRVSGYFSPFFVMALSSEVKDRNLLALEPAGPTDANVPAPPPPPTGKQMSSDGGGEALPAAALK